MTLVMNNQENDFYNYMGKIFGSRVIEKQTNDRFYDDIDKVWYMSIKENKVLACVSIKNNIIKNIYTTKEEYLEEILEKIKEDTTVSPSIVTNLYIDSYKKCGYNILENESYKNFVTIHYCK